MDTISANDLKTKGVSLLEAALADAEEVAISVRGKSRFVVMEIEQYRHLREQELFAAWLESKVNIAAGDVRAMTAAEHRREIEALLAHKPGAEKAPHRVQEDRRAYGAVTAVKRTAKARRRRG
jgi:prevent-host-death family protein